MELESVDSYLAYRTGSEWARVPGIWRGPMTDQQAELLPGQLLIDLVADTPARLVATGEIDMATSDRFAERLIRAAREHGPIIVDLRPTSFIDSQGIHRLVANHDKVAAVWVRRNGLPSRVLALSGLENYLRVVSH